MSLVGLVVVLIVIGILLYCINQYLPMDPKIKAIINIVVVVAAILFVLAAFGILGSLGTIRVPQVR